MAVLFFFLVTMLFILLLTRTESRDRVFLVGILMVLYTALIIIEQYYLQTNFARYFHPSDPSEYYRNVAGKTWKELVSMMENGQEKSNTFYFYINWIFLDQFGIDLYPVLLKIVNLEVFFSAYLLLTSHQKKVANLDWLLLLHPYLMVMVIRNIRDFYIIFFLALFLFLIERKRFGYLQLVLASFSAGITLTIRSFFVALYAMLVVDRFSQLLQKLRKAFVWSAIITTLTLVWVFREWIIQKTISVYLSIILNPNGPMTEDPEFYTNIVQGGGSPSQLLGEGVVRVFKGFVVFLLTPHPINYTVKYLQFARNGFWNIYTDVDNWLIIAGSVTTYLFVFPLFLKYLHRYKEIPVRYHLINFFIIIVYTVYQLGITDTRIKYTLMFFLILSFMKSNQQIGFNKRDLKYFGVSFCLFVLISLLSV